MKPTQEASMDDIFAAAKTAEPGFLSLVELQAALEHCMKEHPPQGLERAMHKDADRMAGLWAVMHLERIDKVPLNSVDSRILEAFGRWGESHAQG
jgi:hypothetical protein